MKSSELKRALQAAIDAARLAGDVMRRNFHSTKRVNETHAHDIKLELDVRCQKLIQRSLHDAFPEVALLGEEGISGAPDAPARWVVDPIDGTVNFAYGIPHAAVSIALQTLVAPAGRKAAHYETQAGVVFDPFCDELWTALRGGPARLNDRVIHASRRARLSESIVSVGFSKTAENIERILPAMRYLLHRVRKIRIMGSAALSVVYVASGRFDAYVETGLRLWDVAAGGLILECAGGEFWNRPIPDKDAYEIKAHNGLLLRQLTQIDRTFAGSKGPGARVKR